MPLKIRQELEQFFINYNAQAGKNFKPLEWIQPDQAIRTIDKARDQAEPSKLIQLFLPLYDDAGIVFPEKYYAAVKKKLIARYGGVSIYKNAPVSGLWKRTSACFSRWYHPLVFSARNPFKSADHCSSDKPMIAP